VHENDAALRHVRGLLVPDLLLDLLQAGAWHHPGDAVLAELMPWFTDPLDFLASIQTMTGVSRSLDRLVQIDASAQVLRLARGSTVTDQVELPWLDVDQAFFIATAKYAGDDTAVALDYRTGASTPRVVASDVSTDPRQYRWRIVAETFPTFAAGIGLSVSR
jgi:hypothetical protein